MVYQRNLVLYMVDGVDDIVILGKFKLDPQDIGNYPDISAYRDLPQVWGNFRYLGDLI